MASANSSMSKKPSQSTSESFQIFERTEFGSFDLMSSDLAAKIKSKHKINQNFGGVSLKFTCTADFSVDWIQKLEHWISSLPIARTNPVNFTRTSVNAFSFLVSER
jgi:hypothetical protein